MRLILRFIFRYLYLYILEKIFVVAVVAVAVVVVVLPLYRLERLLNSQVMLCKPQVIPRPPLELKQQGEFSDLTLTSVEGKSIQCHKCVLVARSGECCAFVAHQ